MYDRPIVQSVKITYVGHATVIVESSNIKFITDPLLVRRIARIGPRRLVKFKFKKSMLKDLDFILISHGHFDHLDLRSLRMISKKIPVICHPSLKRLVRKSGHKRIIPLELWQSTRFRGVKITAVPAFHFSARPPFHFKKDYQGYIVETDRTTYFSGDTGMSGLFEEIGNKFHIDICVLPIAAYHPPSFRKTHLSPEDALEAMQAMNAKLLIPVHWGTFDLSWEDFREPPKRLMYYAKKKGLEENVMLVKHGQYITV